KKTKEPFKWPNSKEEFIPGKTPQAFIDMGQATGLSPERLKYGAGELFTSNSMWAALMGKAYDSVFGKLEKSQKEEHIAQVLAKTPVVSRFFGITNPYSKHAKSIDEAEEKSVLERFVQNRGMDVLVRGNLYEGNVSEDKIYEYAASFNDRDIRDRLIERYKWEVAIRDLPEKSFWRRLKGMSAEAKARAFTNRLKGASPEEEEKLWTEYSIISRAGGVVGDEFRKEFRRLMSEKDN
ncbi:MAG: hypothetical protein ACK416_04395, partial [Zestosphaera sp.]